MKYMPKEAPFLQALFSCLPITEEFVTQPGFFLDGSTCLIFDHRSDKPVRLGFQTTDAIEKNTFSCTQKEFLYELSNHVKQVFGI